jgi:hypothetical protein
MAYRRCHTGAKRTKRFLVLFFKKELLPFTFSTDCHRLESGKELAQKQV